MKKMFEIALFAGLIGIFGIGEVLGMKAQPSAPPLQKHESRILRTPLDAKTSQSLEGKAEFDRRKAAFERSTSSSGSSTDARSSVATSRQRQSLFGSGRQGAIVNPSEKPQASTSGSIAVAVTPVTSTKITTKTSTSSPGGKPLTVDIQEVKKFEKPELQKTKSESSLGKTPALTVKIGSGKKIKTPDATEGKVQTGTVMVNPTITKRPSFSKSKTMKAEQSSSSPSSSSHKWVDGKKPTTKRKTDIKIGGHRMAAAGAGAIALALGIAGIDAVNDDDDGNSDAVVGPAPTQEVVEKPVDVSEKQNSSADIFAVDDGDGGFGFN